LKILLENMLRHEAMLADPARDVEALARWEPAAEPSREINFTPARVLLQDFTGVPAVVDLAAMRDAMKRMGGDPARINPLQPAELVIDHSVQVDEFGTRMAFRTTSSSSTSGTASGTLSCAGASGRCATSGSCRRAPASCTRSTWSIWRASCSTRKRTDGRRRRTRTRWSAPTRTPPW
jgi:hypothetical protein